MSPVKEDDHADHHEHDGDRQGPMTPGGVAGSEAWGRVEKSCPSPTPTPGPVCLRKKGNHLMEISQNLLHSQFLRNHEIVLNETVSLTHSQPLKLKWLLKDKERVTPTPSPQSPPKV